MEQPFAAIADRYDRLNDLLSLGQHRRWKRKLVREVLGRVEGRVGGVIDISCGTGDVAARAAGVTSGVIGLDPCREMLNEGRGRGGFAPVEGVTETLPFRTGTIRAITCAFGVRNFWDESTAYAEWRRVLAPGGVAGILEVHPIPKSWYRPGVRIYWNRVVPWMGQLYGNRAAYSYLRDTANRFRTAEELISDVSRAGLRYIGGRSLLARGMVTITLFTNDDGT